MLTNFEIMLSPLSSKVNFFSDRVDPKIRNKKKLKGFIEFLFKNEKNGLQSINYVFCTDKKIRNINKDYLNHDYSTDILTFLLSENTAPIVSEVYISVDRVKQNAADLGIDYNSELHRVILHGALHLCGYSDKTQAEKEIMREREDFYLFKYFS